MTQLRILQIFAEAIDDFLLYARVDGRLPKTMQTYHQTFQDFLRFLGTAEISLTELTQGEFRRWISTRLNENYSKVTINMQVLPRQSI